MWKKRFRFSRWRRIRRTRIYSPTLSRPSHLLLPPNPLNPDRNPRPKLPNALPPESMDTDTKRKQTAKKNHISQITFPAHVKLVDATPLYPTTSIKLCWTGVMPEMFTTGHIKEGSARVSVYSCLLYVPGSASVKCNYSTSNSSQMGTHICWCHLRICIQCKSVAFTCSTPAT